MIGAAWLCVCVRACAFTRTESLGLHGASEEWQVASCPRHLFPFSFLWAIFLILAKCEQWGAREKDRSDAVAGGGGCATAQRSLAFGKGAHCILAISISAFPGKFLSVPTLPSSCCSYPTQGFVLWRPSGLGEGSKGLWGRRELGGMGRQLGGWGGVCC